MTMAAGVLQGYSDPANAREKALLMRWCKRCREFEERGIPHLPRAAGAEEGTGSGGAGGENKGVLPKSPLRGCLPHRGGNRREIFAEREWLRYKKLI